MEPQTLIRARVLAALTRARRPVITGHVGMDGDALGSAYALWHGLSSMGATPRVLVNEAPARVFEFIVPEGSTVLLQSEAQAREELATSDLLIVVDNNERKRLGHLAEPSREAPMICIDHHPAERLLCDDHWVDTAAAATGVMVYELLAALGLSIDAPIATCIYTAIVNDTGWFRHENTDERAMRTAERAIAAGARPSSINRSINHRETVQRKKLLARFLSTLEVTADGACAFGHTTAAMLRETGTEAEDTEAFVEHVRSLEGVRMGAYLREQPDGQVKLSFRSVPGCSARNVALRFGGGGHEVAAGALHKGPLERAIEQVRAAVAAECQRTDQP